MSDSVPSPPVASDIAPDAAPVVAQLLPAATAAEPGSASAPTLGIPSALPTETHALLELIARGLAPDADEPTRAIARDLWAQFAQALAPGAAMPAASATPAVPAMPAAPALPPVPMPPVAPIVPSIPVPMSPIAVTARALRQMTPDQRLDLLLTHLRSRLPAGATVPIPKGVQFQFIPVTPPSGAR
jgi:hypothetical protein